MSVASRSIARLPLEVFQGLQESHFASDEPMLSPSATRSAIAFKLQSASPASSFSTRPGRFAMSSNILTVGDFLQLSLDQIMFLVDPLLSYAECKELYQRICRVCSPLAHTALELRRRHASIEPAVLPTKSIPVLDSHLHGGFRVDSITEVVGPPGIGKTAIALQTAVHAAVDNQVGTIFIDTEQKLNLQRVRQLAAAAVANKSSKRGTHISSKTVMDNISVQKPMNTQELLQLLSTTLEDEIALRDDVRTSMVTEVEGSVHTNRFPARLIILDSIAAPLRRDFGGANASAASRAAAVITCAQSLKRLAHLYQLAVIIINQVSSSHGHGNYENSAAALGNSWHHCTSTRVVLEFDLTQEVLGDSDPRDENKNPSLFVSDHHHMAPYKPRRLARVEKSNVSGLSVHPVPFTVTATGVERE